MAFEFANRFAPYCNWSLNPGVPCILLARGRKEEAKAVMTRFGAAIKLSNQSFKTGPAVKPATLLVGRALIAKLCALSITAIAWGLINFGLLLWLPGELVNREYSVVTASKLLTQSALLALPTVFLAALLYSWWSTKWTVVS